MGTPLGVFTGVWFALFGGAVLWWCVTEMATRRTLRRRGRSGTARVITDDDPAAATDTAPLLCFQAEGHGEIVTRPRGWTTLRRAPLLAAGTIVAVDYDPDRPQRVVVGAIRQRRADAFWLALGLVFLLGGAAVLATSV